MPVGFLIALPRRKGELSSSAGISPSELFNFYFKSLLFV
jgi:hypothetical protein